MQPADCYKILGVSFGASIEEVTVAYNKLSEKFHPSANAGDPFFQKRLKEVEEAYQILTNLTSAAPSIPKRKNRGIAIAGSIFGILIIAVTIFKFVNETKKASDTRQKLSSLGLLPKDSDKTTSGSVSSDETHPPIRILKNEIFIMAMIDDANSRLEVYPSFTIFNAKNVLCHARLYFYDDQGIHLKTENRSEYTDADGNILTSIDFQPQDDQVTYSSSHSDLVLRIPYSKLYQPPGTDHVKYELYLYDDNWTLLDNSELLKTTLPALLALPLYPFLH